MLVIARPDDLPVAVGCLFGVFDQRQILAELTRAYARRILAPGRSRLFTMGALDTAEVVGVDDLRGIATHLRDLEGGAGGFDSVFIASDDRHAALAEIYMTLSELTLGRSNGPRYHLVRDVDDGVERLGLPRETAPRIERLLDGLRMSEEL